MPRLKRHTVARREFWEPAWTAYLTDGDGPFRFFGSPRMSVLEEAWRCRESELLGPFIADFPGHRPWGWWQFDRPGDRELIAADMVRVDGGEPHYFGGQWGLPRFHRVPNVEPVFESETDFLKRHGLLSDTEREALNDERH